MDNLILQIINAFRNTLHMNVDVRKNAEATIENLKKESGYSRVLLKIIASNEIEISTRQAVAIYLKNMVLHKWNKSTTETEETYITKEDGEFIRENLIDALVHCDHLVQNQIEYMIGTIADKEFPTTWTSLMPKSIQLITSQDIKNMMAGLTTFQLAIRRFQYIPSGNKKREPLFKVVEESFPLLLQVFQLLGNVQSTESAILQRKICKIYIYTINFEIPKLLVQPEVFQAWFKEFGRIIQRGISPQENSKDFDGLFRNPWWILKKTTSRILNIVLRRAAVTRKADHKTSRDLHKLFMPKYSIEVMQLLLTELEQRNQKYNNNLINQGYLRHLIEYFAMSINFGITWCAFKPKLQAFFETIVFPLICYDDRDQELFESDPQEFMRAQIDSSSSHMSKKFYTPRLESVNFVIDAASKRGRQYFDSIMQFCIQKLNEYQQQPLEQRQPRIKEGIFTVLTVLSTFLINTSPYKSNLEQMLILHVFPELQSPLGFMRYRALTVFSEFYSIKYTDPSFFRNALHLVLNLMGDKELAVRTRAGSSLCNLVLVPTGTNEIRPILPQILDKIFVLLGESESDELILTIESIINKFKEEVAPYALDLAQKLTESFIQLAEAEKEDPESGVGSQECLKVLMVLLKAMRNIPRIFNQLETIIMPVLKLLITEDHFFYLEDALIVLTYLTYYPKKISELSWQMFPQMMHVFDACACDLISSFLSPIDNYISYGTETFLYHNNGEFLQLIIKLYKKMIDDVHMEPIDCSDACKIMESVIQRCMGKVDGIIPIVLESTCKRLLNTSKDNLMSKEFSVYLLEIIANCLIYNPYITVDYLTQNNLIQPVFNKWFASIKRFQRFYDKKLTVLAFSAILSMNPVPAFAVYGSNVIIPMMMTYTSDMMVIEENLDKADREREERIKAGKATEEDIEIERAKTMGEDDEYEEDVNLLQQVDNDEFEWQQIADNEDCEPDDEHEMFMDDLENATKVTKHFMEGGYDVELEDSGSEAEVEGDIEGDEDEELFESEQYTEFESPLDEVDGLEIMIKSLQNFFTLNPQQLATAMSPENQAKLQEYSNGLPARQEKIRLEKLKEKEEEEKRNRK
ncbi:hypothetical protein DLAC_04540 [Tieghemostelium lacteum]|uniref:Importin N-terminal domain-containing protein n=1 Tax=Tieghemostelium lacteum TaxID=361077 RepID=A0A151ZK03_TIELA|nr:hypothetical protein DLAC_04540 [Tieghemostelium lacteum]|eukprot:KYQ94245.1 hypothetical protein DLAC_04540 [Tieghemostelium lacteum]